MRKLLEIHGNKIIHGVILLLFSFNAVIWREVFAETSKPDISVSFFDVGQGDAEFISLRDGTQILIDGGPGTRILPELAGAMPYFDRSIDAIISSHPHADHVAGLIEVLNRYEVGVIFESGVNYDTAEYVEFRKIAKIKNIPVVIVDGPLSVNLFGGASIRFIFPDASYENKTIKDVNESSLVAYLIYGEKKILFTGDAGAFTERKLFSRGFLEDVDVLKVGHQGSKFSSTKEFLAAVLPEYAVISVGKNSYGHPHADALARLASVGAKIFRTDINGTLTLEIRDGRLFWK